jgi:glutathione synthase/RimK-type ligase-like ATP-grasp enzyme
LDDLELHRVRVLNPPALVRWSLHKRYLLDLARWGARVPRTEIVAADPASIATVIERRGWDVAVLKPAVGASGHGVRLVRAVELRSGGVPFAATGSDLVVQEYLPEVAGDGEMSLVFFDGAYSHAALKRPAAGDFRVNSQYQGSVEPFQPDDGLVRRAQDVLALLPEVPLYARVDAVARSDNLIVTELELIEPALFLGMASDAAARFALATLRRLEQGEGAGLAGL